MADTKVVGREHLSDDANNVLDYIENHKGNPPEGYRGGKVYKNEPRSGEQLLPDKIKYKEYDVHPKVKGTPRGEERLVIGDDGSVWFTQDHYKTFIRIK